MTFGQLHSSRSWLQPALAEVVEEPSDEAGRMKVRKTRDGDDKGDSR